MPGQVKDIYWDSLSLSALLEKYRSPKSKLTTMLEKNEVIQVRRGLFVPGGELTYSEKVLANKIYRPSYISFEYALSYYGFIPERVEQVTSAIFKKNRNKVFYTKLGTYVYRSVPDAVFSLAYHSISENDHPVLIASKEKALCDTLYKYRKINTLTALNYLLVNDLRIDLEVLSEIDVNIIEQLVPLYKKRVLGLFLTWIKKEL